MNSSELFLLAVSLYGHDWGMALSDFEKECILGIKKPENNKTTKENIWILPKEKVYMSEFAYRNNLNINSEGTFEKISDEQWCDYVRATHASRSSFWVSKYFEDINKGVAEQGDKICAGHWLDFKEIQNLNNYSKDATVLEEDTNICALTVYLRLIDLFDISEYRTPYLIWKYVSPTNSISKLEWQKHRAIQSVDVKDYAGESRKILVEGSTDDFEVYNQLELLRIYCEDQLKGDIDTLALVHDERHSLDINKIEWRVEAKGFQPSNVQFEFNRERMFEILSDEIYESDPYVFLRELLQNSIDAIRFRQKILSDKASTEFYGCIRVELREVQNGKTELTWIDNGIGMNKNVVDNYLAIVGKSFYRSVDFEREKIDFDPISRFGIGMLSCFIVADQVEILTRLDPNYQSDNEGLLVIISSIFGRFLIKTVPSEDVEIGTTIKIDINKPFNNVTRYLSEIAGFVEYPILINEFEAKTIIIHPKHNIEDVVRSSKVQIDGYKLHQLNYNYMWEEVFPTNYLAAAKKLFKEEHFDIKDDLSISEDEGIICYLVPDVNKDFETTGSINDELRYFETYNNRGIESARVGYFGSSTINSQFRNVKGLSKSSNSALGYKVYLNGILMSECEWPASFYSTREHFIPTCKILYNIKNNRKNIPNIARSNLVVSDKKWHSEIHEKYVEIFVKQLIEYRSSKTRFNEIGKIVSYKFVGSSSLLEHFPKEHWPFPYISSRGVIEVKDFKEVDNKELLVFPDGFEREFKKMLDLNFEKLSDYSGVLNKWKGKPSIISISRWRTNFGIKLEGMLYLSNDFFDYHCVLKSIRFLHPFSDIVSQMAQRVYSLNEKCEDVDIKHVLNKAIDEPNNLDIVDLKYLNEQLYRVSYNLPLIVNFEPPYSNKYAYGTKYINISNDKAQTFIRCFSSLISDQMKQDDLSNIAPINEKLFDICESYSYTGDSKFENYQKLYRDFLNSINEIGMFKLNVEDNLPQIQDFVPGTLITDYNGRVELSSPYEYGELPKGKMSDVSDCFGEQIKKEAY